MSEVTTATKGINAKKFEGKGLLFKCKVIGMEDLPVDRNETICLESISKLKAIARVRGEHKQKIQLNLTIDAVKVVDEITRVLIASHEVRRISFVVKDPSDPRTFGYVYNTSDHRHQFWALKAIQSAVPTILGFEELFRVVFEQLTDLEKIQTQAKQTNSTPVLSEEYTTARQQSSTEIAPIATSHPPIVSAETAPQATQASTIPLSDNIWGSKPSTTVPQSLQSTRQSTPNADWWELSESIASAKESTSLVDNPTDDLFSLFASPSAVATTVQQAAPTLDTCTSFSMYSDTASIPLANTNMFARSTQPAMFNTKQRSFLSMPLTPQEQSNVPGLTSLSPTTTSVKKDSLDEFDLLGDFSQ